MSENLHRGHRQRVRERFAKEGLGAFEDHQILELLLFYCIPMRDTNELAHKLLKEFGSLHILFESDPNEISIRCGVSHQTAVLLAMIPQLANRYLVSRWNKKIVLDSSKTVGEFAINLFAGRTNEAFYLFCLDAQRRLTHPALINEGTIDETPVYPREVVISALKYQAVSVILAHNHPGGGLKPSRSDVEATEKIIKALEYIKIDVLDHVIVADDKYFCFSSKHILGLG